MKYIYADTIYFIDEDEAKLLSDLAERPVTPCWIRWRKLRVTRPGPAGLVTFEVGGRLYKFVEMFTYNERTYGKFKSKDVLVGVPVEDLVRLMGLQWVESHVGNH